MSINRDDIVLSHEAKLRCGKRCLTWSAIFAGALVGIGVSFLLNLLTVALGFNAFIHTDTGAQTIAVGGFIGLIIVAIISMSSLGWVAGYLGGKHAMFCTGGASRCNMGCLYGFIAWCLALVLIVLLSASFEKFVATSTASLSNTPYAAQTVSTVKHEAGQTAKQTTTTVNTTVSDEEAAKAMVAVSFVTFLLFFIGALSAVLAGHCGFKRSLDRCVTMESEVK